MCSMGMMGFPLLMYLQSLTELLDPDRISVYYKLGENAAKRFLTRFRVFLRAYCRLFVQRLNRITRRNTYMKLSNSRIR
jgi:hypothetical protein